jgi:hypothetical protein
VIQDADIEERESLFQASGDELVGLTGLCYAGRMIVEEDDSGGVSLEHDACDLARVHGGTGDRAAEENPSTNESMAGVEEQKAKDFIRQRADLVPQVLTRALGVAEHGRAGAEALRHEGRGTVEYLVSGGCAELLAVANKERVSHERRLQVKLTTVLPHGG